MGKFNTYTSEGSILKVDLKGFSTFSRKAKTHEMRAVPHSIFDRADLAAVRNGGIPLKRDGDATTISFNIETPLKDVQEGAIASVRSGLQMQDAIEQARQELELEGDILRGRIGISTGELEFSEYLSGKRALQDINGFPMSIATRLESSAGLGEVQVDGKTKNLAEKRFEWEERGKIELKGVGEVEIYRPLKEIITTFDLRGMREAFFGREDEVAAIKQYLRKGGDPILLSGDMGIGKTSTAEQAMPGRTLVKFSVLDRTDTFSLLKHFYRTLFRGRDIEESLEKLGYKEEYPYVALALGMDAQRISQDPEIRKMKIIEAYHKIRERFEWVLLDDMQWADPLSVEIIRTSPTTQRNVMTGRPEFDPDFPVNKIALSDLGGEYSRQIVEEFLGGQYEKLDRTFVNRILARTKGNPFHTKYLSISLREKMELGIDPEEALTEIPTELNSLIVSRIREYGDHIFRAFRVGSHLRRKWIYRSDIESLLGEKLDEDALQKMTKAGLINLSRETTVEVRDEKVLEVIYDTTPPDEQRKIHGEWGNYYQGLLNDLDDSEKSSRTPKYRALLLNTADQYSLSDDRGKAVGYLVELGKMEREGGATETSLEHLKTALGILDSSEQDANTREKQKEVLRELELTQREARLMADRSESQERLATMHTEDYAKEVIGRYRSMICHADSINRTDPEKALPILTEALDLARIADDTEWTAKGLVSMGGSHSALKDYENAEMCYRTALALAQQCGDTRQIYAAHNSLGIILSKQERLDDAETEYQLAIQIAESIGHKGLVAGTKRNLAYLEDKRGNNEKVLSYLQESLQFSRESGRTETQLDALCNIASIYKDSGRNDLAEPYIDEGMVLLSREPKLRKLAAGQYIERQLEKENNSIAN